MSISLKNFELLSTDVLIIGGGFAGCWAALRARDFVDNVILVDKAKVAKSGCSTFAAGVQFCPMPEDDVDILKKEIVESGEYFPDQDWLTIFLQNQMERIQDYERWGAPIEKDEKGKILRIAGRAHIHGRLFQFRGPELMSMLREKVLSKGVKLIERTMVVDLLTSDGIHPTKNKVIGAIGLHTRNGKFIVFKARATIIATGGIAGKRGFMVDNLMGDGIAIAFRAGAEVTNMEFCTNGNISVWERKGIAAGINMIQGYGAHFINAKGERFMKKYDPLLIERAQLSKLCMAFCKETLEGRGPVYVDMTHFTPEIFKRFKIVLPRTMLFWELLGIDVSKQKIESTPCWRIMTVTGPGGIKIGQRCETNILGLFAAGATIRDPAQGIYSVGGMATASCNVTGYIAGENAGMMAQENKISEMDKSQVQLIIDNMSSPLYSKHTIRSDQFVTKLDQTFIPAKYSMFKSESRITKVLAEINKIQQDLPKLYASDTHDLVKAIEFKNYLLCAELVFRAALERKESRQYHYNQNYPYRNDKEWLKLVILRKENDHIIISYEPIPIDRWPIKPAKMLKISHPIQMFISD